MTAATTRKIGDVCVVEISERRLTQPSADADAVWELIKSLIEAGEKKLLVNLERVAYMDSTALGRLVKLYIQARRAGGDLKLSNPGARIADLLQISKLVNVLEVAEGDDWAV